MFSASKTLVILIVIVLISPLSKSLAAQSLDRFRDQDCLDCHGKPQAHQILEDGQTRSIFVDPEKWADDVHRKKNILCVDCHRNASPSLHFREGFPDVDCSRCHPEEAEEYTKNIHFEYKNVSPGKVLPQCHDCHTKHHVLLHDNPDSSVYEKNIGETCGSCHAEVMVRGIFKGTSLGKMSGHRKGDLSYKFDMKVCISCHYEDSAHGNKRVFKDFCSRCHDVRNKGNILFGPIHLDSVRWSGFNAVGSGLVLLLLVGFGGYIGFRSRKKIVCSLKEWQMGMKVEEEFKQPQAEPKEQNEQAKTEGGIDESIHSDREAESEESKDEQS